MSTQKEISNLMKIAIEAKPKSGAGVKDFSSPGVGTEITDDFEVVPSETIIVVSGDDDASNTEKASLDISSDRIVTIVEKVAEAEVSTEF